MLAIKKDKSLFSNTKTGQTRLTKWILKFSLPNQISCRHLFLTIKMKISRLSDPLQKTQVFSLTRSIKFTFLSIIRHATESTLNNMIWKPIKGVINWIIWIKLILTIRLILSFWKIDFIVQIKVAHLPNPCQWHKKPIQNRRKLLKIIFLTADYLTSVYETK